MSIKDEIMEYVREYKHQDEFGYELSTEELAELGRYDDVFCEELYKVVGKSKIEVLDENIPGYKTLKIFKVK